jgi:hypothetical protein
MARKAVNVPMTFTVAEFLERFVAELEIQTPVWHEQGRRLAEIADLDLTRNQVLEELKQLKPSHHHRGPEPDDAEPEVSAVHKFKYIISGTSTRVYVKIALKMHPAKRNVLIPKIWSFKRW